MIKITVLWRNFEFISDKNGVFPSKPDCLMVDPMNVLRTQDRSDVPAITDLTNYVPPRLRYMLGEYMN